MLLAHSPGGGCTDLGMKQLLRSGGELWDKQARAPAVALEACLTCIPNCLGYAGRACPLLQLAACAAACAAAC